MTLVVKTLANGDAEEIYNVHTFHIMSPNKTADLSDPEHPTTTDSTNIPSTHTKTNITLQAMDNSKTSSEPMISTIALNVTSARRNNATTIASNLTNLLVLSAVGTVLSLLALLAIVATALLVYHNRCRTKSDSLDSKPIPVTEL